jgi:LPS-assembly lipoprotein
MSLSRCAIVLLLAVLAQNLGACGYQLPVAFTVPAEMERTYIETDDRFSLFYRAFRKELLAAGVNIVDTSAESTASFTIYFDRTDQRVLSVSARNVPTEFEVFYTIQYGLMSGDVAMLEVQDMTLTRDYTYDETLVLGKAREEEVMRDAIVQDLVRIILKQISAQ